MLVRILLAVAVVLVSVASSAMAADKEPRTRFWNLTGDTISKLELAPAGTTDWGPDQCKNDKDGTVDNDERLKIVGVPAGTYDARLTFPKGRVCFARGLKVEIGGIFSVEASELKDCTP
jgi:hypothetical protein